MMFCLLQVLWKEIQALQVEQELDREFGSHGGAGGHGGHGGHGGYPDRRMEREKRRLTERKLGRLIGGAESRLYDDSDSSRGETCILPVLRQESFEAQPREN